VKTFHKSSLKIEDFARPGEWVNVPCRSARQGTKKKALQV